MAVVRSATETDATWARAWRADTFADLADIPTPEDRGIGGRHGDVAYVVDEGLWYNWRDDDTWQASGTGTGSSFIPLSLGVEPLQFVSDGAGHAILVAYP